MKKLLKQITPQFLIDQYSVYAISKAMRRTLEVAKAKKNWTAEEAIDFLFSKDAELFTPWQYKEEILALAKKIEEKKPKVVLEIGTAAGGTLFLASLLADENAQLISIDLPLGLYGGGYPDWKTPIYQSIAREGQSMFLIRDDSHLTESFEKVKSCINGNKVDYLFIDGDHTYEGVKTDFELYGELVGEKGLIAFHDIVSDKSEKPDHFVSVLWNEIKDNYEHFEFVKSWEQSKLGLGLLIK